MKEIFYYKIKIFLTKEFCILSFLSIVCLVFLGLFVFNIRIYVDLDNKICDNINSVLVSLTSGYLISYLVYLLSIHIPAYSQTIVNDRIICNHLLLYKDRLLCSFGGLIYKLKKDESFGDVIDIPEITNLFKSQEDKDKFVIEIIQKNYNSTNDNLLLAKDFERLEDSFQELLRLNAIYKGIFSHDIYQLQISCWSDVIYIIKDEINNRLDNFKILSNQDAQLLINQNFDFVNKAIKVNNLINR